MTDRESEINAIVKIIKKMLKSSKITLTSHNGVLVVKDETNGKNYGIYSNRMITIEQR